MEGSKSHWAKAATACSRVTRAPVPQSLPGRLPGWALRPAGHTCLWQQLGGRSILNNSDFQHSLKTGHPLLQQERLPSSKPHLAPIFFSHPLSEMLGQTGSSVLPEYPAQCSNRKEARRPICYQPDFSEDGEANEWDFNRHPQVNQRFKSWHTWLSASQKASFLEGGYSIHPLASGTKGTAARSRSRTLPPDLWRARVRRCGAPRRALPGTPPAKASGARGLTTVRAEPPGCDVQR